MAWRVRKQRPTNLGRACAFLTLANIVGVGETARAAEAAEAPPVVVRIDQQLPDGCPREPTIFARLQSRLPRVREAVEGESAISIEVRVQRRGNVNHGTIALVAGGERAEREASSPSCERVLTALAVMAAIGLENADAGGAVTSGPRPTELEPSSTERPLDTNPDNDTPPTPTAHVPDRSATPDVRQTVKPGFHELPRVRPRVSFSLGTGLELAVNHGAVVLPDVFAQLRLAVRFAPLLRLGFGRSFRGDLDTTRGNIGFRWSVGRMTSCVALVHDASLSFGPCLEAEAGRLEAAVVAPLPALVRSTGWFAAGASARIEWRLLRALSLDFIGGARVPLVRTQLLFEPATLVYEAPVVVPFIGTAVIANLP